MHPLVTQLSAIVALFVMLNQLWGAASIERTLVVSAMTGIVAYSVLFAGQLTLRYVLAQSDVAAQPDAAAPQPTPPPAGTSAEAGAQAQPAAQADADAPAALPPPATS